MIMNFAPDRRSAWNVCKADVSVFLEPHRLHPVAGDQRRGDAALAGATGLDPALARLTWRAAIPTGTATGG